VATIPWVTTGEYQWNRECFLSNLLIVPELIYMFQCLVILAISAPNSTSILLIRLPINGRYVTFTDRYL